jgi:hypothetical protein
MYEMGIEIQNLNVWYWKIPQLNNGCMELEKNQRWNVWFRLASKN